MIARQSRLLTLDEFLEQPETEPYTELIDGVLEQKPVGKKPHSRSQLRIALLLLEHPATKGGSAWPEPGLRFPNTAAGNLRVPDLSYYLPGNIDEDDDEDYPARPPDLCVEVRSMGQSAAGQQDRLAFLREQSVGCTLLIDPESRTVEVYDRGRAWVASAKDEVVLSGLGGFTFRVGELFA